MPCVNEDQAVHFTLVPGRARARTGTHPDALTDAVADAVAHSRAYA